MKPLLSFFVDRPLLVNLILVFVILSGLIIASGLQYNTYPKLDLGAVTIITARPGASAEDVELSITKPIEEELLNVDGLDKIISSSFEGRSNILVRMDQNQNSDENDRTEDAIQRAIDRAAGRLPDDLPFKPYASRHLSDRVPIVDIMISGNVPEETLRTSARHVKNALRDVPGVAGVGKKAYRKREVRILLDANQIQKYGIRLEEIRQAIKGRNFRESSGSLNSATSEHDVIVVGQFKDPKEVEDVVIRSNDFGNVLRIKDIARVVYDYEDWTEMHYSNGEMGITLLPRRKSDADGLTVSNDLHTFVDDIRSKLPHGVEIKLINDLSRFTRSMLDVLLSNALLGMLLVFAVLYMFFPLKFTFWVTLGIPTAVIAAFALMPVLGLTVSQLSMSAVILMLGILVDDAVVTSESIFRRSEQGYSPRDAAILGTADVAPPVITSAATTMLAFAPAAFLGGIEGKFMWVVPAMAMLVLITSLFECKLLLPSHLRSSLEHSKTPPKARVWFNRFELAYEQLMQTLIARRYLTIVVFLGIFISILVWSLNRVAINLYPDVAVDSFYIQVEFPNGASIEKTRDRLLHLETEIRGFIKAEDVDTINIVAGHHDYDIKQPTSGMRPNWGLIGVYLKPLDQRDTDVLQLMADLRQHMRKQSDVRWSNITPQRETPVTGEAVELDIVGNDDSRYELADKLIHYLREHHGTLNAWTSYSPGKDVIDMELNHQAIAQYGLTVQEVAASLRVAFDGLIIEELQTISERIDYRLQFDHPDQGSIAALQSLNIVNQLGLPVSLRAIADFRLRPGEAAIKHYFGDRSLTIYADIDRDKISTAQINLDLIAYIEAQDFERQYNNLRIVYGGQFHAQNEAIDEVKGAFALCMVGIFFVLVLLFNSLSQPLLTLSVIPLGFVGVFFAFALQGIELSMAAMMGILGLAGVLVNDSLVLIDRLNQGKQHPRHLLSNLEIVAGAKVRLRPIVITSVTTVAGLFPAAYGLLGENPFITSMIMAMLWGVLFGSLVTLFFLPCVYALEQDGRHWLRKLRGTEVPSTQPQQN